MLDKQDCVNLGVKICKYDFLFEGKNVEAVAFQPEGTGKFPGLLIIHGHNSNARNFSLYGYQLAREGFACITISQPGYGKSGGPPDYVGPKTIRTLTAAYRKFQREPYVDAQRMGAIGGSRGGMAVSLMAVQLDDLRAAVLIVGVYDFKRLYDETGVEGIRENMRKETGMTPEAIKERSSVLFMEKLKCPVLILHGEKDINSPVSQALLLRDRLAALKKDFEIKLFPDKDHALDRRVTDEMTLDFFKRRLAGVATKK
jgi:dipeptidyl aminopeptidase/acylaminoacyl peptidase